MHALPYPRSLTSSEAAPVSGTAPASDVPEHEPRGGAASVGEGARASAGKLDDGSSGGAPPPTPRYRIFVNSASSLTRDPASPPDAPTSVSVLVPAFASTALTIPREIQSSGWSTIRSPVVV